MKKDKNLMWKAERNEYICNAIRIWEHENIPKQDMLWNLLIKSTSARRRKSRMAQLIHIFSGISIYMCGRLKISASLLFILYSHLKKISLFFKLKRLFTMWPKWNDTRATIRKRRTKSKTNRKIVICSANLN